MENSEFGISGNSQDASIALLNRWNYFPFHTFRLFLVYFYYILIALYYFFVCIYSFVIPKKINNKIEPRSIIADELITFWNNFDIPFKVWLSESCGILYELKISRFLILPFQFLNYENPIIETNYKPPNGQLRYESFQDFFTRELVSLPDIQREGVWPCDGLLCEQGIVSQINLVSVKGELRHIRTIFGKASINISDEDYYRNIFLHNRDYHHIHNPITSTVSSIERIAGDVIVLRPWFNLDNPSRPALINERVIIELVTADSLKWVLALEAF